MDSGNVITIGLDTQTVFFQTTAFYTGQNIQILHNSHLNRYVASFFIPLLKRLMEKFNWGGNGATLTRLKRCKVLLPINIIEEPDYEFMEAYMRDKESALLAQYKKYAQAIDNPEYHQIEPLSAKHWQEFPIDNIFIIKAGKRLAKNDMKKGDLPFIGASDSNNGITALVANENASLDSNVLGVNYNGSVVENFYHPYYCIFSDDVKRFTLKNIQGNKYLYLFVKSVILMQKNKYKYGYKFNKGRMVK